MFLSSLRHSGERTRPASRQVGRRPRSSRLHCEELEHRRVPSSFTFSTGNPDGKIATISEPANKHNNNVEFESADDFVLTKGTVLNHATFTGLLTGGATLKDVSNVVVEIYRVFPKDSDTSRVSSVSPFPTDKVPARLNSPSDVAFKSRDSADKADKRLTFEADVLSTSFTAQASVSDADSISVKSGGDGKVTGEEVKFDVTFRPMNLPADHYFFVPQVGLSDTAPAGSDFLWLSAPKPIVPPGTPFPAGATDLQSWMRDDPPLAPDWLRIGTDIIDGGPPAPTFNASFALSGPGGDGASTNLGLMTAAAALAKGPSVPPALPLATQGNPNGAAGVIPAFFNGQSVNINVKELSDTASASIIEHNKSLQIIYVTNDLDEPQQFAPVINAVPGQGFNALWLQIRIDFTGSAPHQFTSEADILAAANAHEITLTSTGEVYRDSVVGVSA